MLGLALILTIAAKPGDKANFTGTWSLNEARSDLGKGSGTWAYKKISVHQHESSITIENFITKKNGADSSSVETLRYDGTVSETMLANANGLEKRLRSIKYSNGRSLVITEVHLLSRGGLTSKLDITQTWALTADQTLKIDKILVTGNSTSLIKAVYNKL